MSRSVTILHAQDVRAALVIAISTLASGCVGPLVSDEFGFSARILPADAEIPFVDEDPQLTAQIQENDGLDTNPIPRLQGYAEGQVVYYWDFGETSTSAVPFYSFNNCDEEGNALRGAGRSAAANAPGNRVQRAWRR